MYTGEYPTNEYVIGKCSKCGGEVIKRRSFTVYNNSPVMWSGRAYCQQCGAKEVKPPLPTIEME